MAIIKRRLIIDVTFETDDESQDDERQLDSNLRYIPNLAAGECLFTNDTTATVEEWSYTLENPE